MSPSRSTGQRIQLLATLTLLAFAAGLLWRNLVRENEVANRTLPTDEVPNEDYINWPFDLSGSTVAPDQIYLAVERDFIPALDSTTTVFIAAEDEVSLSADQRVIGVQISDEARAYPLQVLVQHEIVNDRLGGVNIAVTYCPLCDSAVVVNRRVGDAVHEFGVSGLLLNSNLLLFDRRENGQEGLWPQLNLECISGTAQGQTLRTLPLMLTSWGEWKQLFRGTSVLSTATGHDTEYFELIHDTEEFPEPEYPLANVDRRLPAKERVLGTWLGTTSRAYPVSEFAGFQEEVVITDRFAGHDVNLRYNPASGSLSIQDVDNDEIQWVYSFWFAWAAFRPTTSLFELEHVDD